MAAPAPENSFPHIHVKYEKRAITEINVEQECIAQHGG
jgi:hypothetical protein